jgi:hypothetical protein
MAKLNRLVFGSLNVPSTKETHDSAQFTSLAFADVSKIFQVRMYPADTYTGKTVEHPTKTRSLELVGWDVKCS